MKKNATLREISEKITSVYMILLMTVFLFFTGTEGYENIQAGKFAALNIISGGYIALIAILTVETTVIGSNRLMSPVKVLRKSNWIQRFTVLYMLITWISALISRYWPVTIIGATRNEGAWTISLYCISFLLISVYGKADRRLFAVSAVSVTVFDIICFIQFAGRNPLGLYPEGLDYYDAYKAYPGAYLGTIGNVDLVAAFLCLVIPVFFFSALKIKGRRKLLALLPFAFSMIVLVKMSVLAGFVGLGAGLILSACVVCPRTRDQFIFIICAISIFAAAVLLALYIYDGSGFFHELHELLHGRADPSFGSGRLHIWQCVLEAVPEHFWLGSGPDTMMFADLEAFKRYDPDLGKLIVSKIDTAHNEYLNVLFHQGILGLTAYAGILISGCIRWIKDRQNPIKATIGSAICCYCIQAFFGFSMCMTTPLFWALLALLSSDSCAEINKEERVCGKN